MIFACGDLKSYVITGVGLFMCVLKALAKTHSLNGFCWHFSGYVRNDIIQDFGVFGITTWIQNFFVCMSLCVFSSMTKMLQTDCGDILKIARKRSNLKWVKLCVCSRSSAIIWMQIFVVCIAVITQTTATYISSNAFFSLPSLVRVAFKSLLHLTK